MTSTAGNLREIRSLLFSPGSDERKLDRALKSTADAVVADLEDSVVAAAKADARETVARRFATRVAGPARMVRVNGAETEYFKDDLAAFAEIDLAAIVLPKATPEAVAVLGEVGSPVIAIIETAQGVRQAYETAASPRVSALLLGAADLGAQLLLNPRKDNQEVLYMRSKLVVDSAAAGIQGPFDMVYLGVDGGIGLEAEACLGRSLGCRGKACIHPSHVEVVNRIFGPNDDELAWAAEVVAAYRKGCAEGRGALIVRGGVIDLALVRRAERILDRATRS